jgi:hypothetical protein
MPADRPTYELLMRYGASAVSSRLVGVWRAASRDLGYDCAWNTNPAGSSCLARRRLQIVTVWRTDQSFGDRLSGRLAQARTALPNKDTKRRARRGERRMSQ